MPDQTEAAICRFYRLVPDAPAPRRADRSADGMVPTRGYRYCEALASASAFGWYLFPPMNFSLVWDGVEMAPTFIAQSRDPGLVQIWSGYLASTAPGWALLSRSPANIPRTQGYEHYEGILETDTWFGPLFTNIRLTRTNSPIEFHKRYPLFQVQPVLRSCYREPSFEVLGMDDL